MRIRIHDKEVRHSLDLTSEELVSLIRFKKPASRRVPLAIVSPVIVVCDDKKFQADILDIKDATFVNREEAIYGQPEYGEEAEGEEWASRPGSSKKAKKDPTEDIPPFLLTVELTPPMFEAMVGLSELLVLVRVQNIPAYIRTKRVKVDYNMEEKERDNVSAKPKLVLKVEQVRPIVDLLKAQITESAFYDVFIAGKSDEFFEKGGEELDEIVGLIGIKRRVEESDIALRMRVKEYLRIRMEQLTKVKEEDVQGMVKEAEEKADIERKLDEADEKRKKEDEK